MTYSYKIEVLIHRRPNLLDSNLEYFMHRGQNILRQIFVEERVDETVLNQDFWFPERWLNIVQERSLYDRLQKYCPKLKSITIQTQSVYIIQCTPAQSCKIVSSHDEQTFEDLDGRLPQESVSGVQSFNVPGVPDFSTLQVFGG